MNKQREWLAVLHWQPYMQQQPTTHFILFDIERQIPHIDGPAAAEALEAEANSTELRHSDKGKHLFTSGGSRAFLLRTPADAMLLWLDTRPSRSTRPRIHPAKGSRHVLCTGSCSEQLVSRLYHG